MLARSREIQEALELDMSIVNQFFEADQLEKETKSRKKEELKKEILMYREHLREFQRLEKVHERELERAYREEEEKVYVMLLISNTNLYTHVTHIQGWRIRAEKWKREQKARDTLMAEVIAGRKEQLKYASITLL